MIQSLHIENFAIIEQLSISFQVGFSVFTGETGAGKSILITALNLLLGNRASTDFIRTGEESATVEGVFVLPETSPVFQLLEERGIDSDEEGKIFIKRKIFRSEKGNRCFINHQPCSVSLLADIGKWLVDIHGQHEHQFLLNPEKHIDLLDAFGHLQEQRSQFASLFEEYEKTRRQYLSMLEQKEKNKQEAELLSFQLNEIDQAHLAEDEEERLETKRRQLFHAEKLLQETTFIADQLYESEGSLQEQLSKMVIKLRQLSEIDQIFTPLSEILENSSYLMQEVASQCRDYSRNIEFNPQLLDEIEIRRDEINKLKRKYGCSVKELLNLRLEKEKNRQSIEQAETKTEDVHKELENLAQKVLLQAEELSKERRKIAIGLEEHIQQELGDLCMPKARFIVDQRRKADYPEEPVGTKKTPLSAFLPFPIQAKGADEIEFFFSANLGEEPKALARIASGGEISRIMLAIKVCLRSTDQIMTLVFDEVDVGIGGDVARMVGEKLKGLASEKQILCITHSPQIASLAEQHYVVRKIIDQGRTTTAIEQLTEDLRIEELARMLGGGRESEISRSHAQQLITKKSAPFRQAQK